MAARRLPVRDDTKGPTMANPGDTLEHPITGERITFLQTSAETRGTFTSLRMEVRPGGPGHAPHVHPRIDERFDILGGEWVFEVAGVQRQAGAGDTITVQAGTAHSWRVSGPDAATTVITLSPSLQCEPYFESLFGLAQDGLTDPGTGLPSKTWQALLISEYGEGFAIPAEPPLAILLEQLRPIAEEAKRQGLRLPYPYPYSRPMEAAGISQDKAAD
jgi:mannose-6-phosphate isomerase-like protein (cupin superfamily)